MKNSCYLGASKYSKFSRKLFPNEITKKKKKNRYSGLKMD